MPRKQDRENEKDQSPYRGLRHTVREVGLPIEADGSSDSLVYAVLTALQVAAGLQYLGLTSQAGSYRAFGTPECSQDQDRSRKRRSGIEKEVSCLPAKPNFVFRNSCFEFGPILRSASLVCGTLRTEDAGHPGGITIQD